MFLTGWATVSSVAVDCRGVSVTSSTPSLLERITGSLNGRPPIGEPAATPVAKAIAARTTETVKTRDITAPKSRSAIMRRQLCGTQGRFLKREGDSEWRTLSGYYAFACLDPFGRLQFRTCCGVTA